MKDNNLKISMDNTQYPPISLPTSYVNGYLLALTRDHKGYAEYLEAKFLEYARVLHNGIVANSRTQVVQRRPVENGEKNRGASGLKSGTYRKQK